jgi:hypothetical protein
MGQCHHYKRHDRRARTAQDAGVDCRRSKAWRQPSAAVYVQHETRRLTQQQRGCSESGSARLDKLLHILHYYNQTLHDEFPLDYAS